MTKLYHWIPRGFLADRIRYLPKFQRTFTACLLALLLGWFSTIAGALTLTEAIKIAQAGDAETQRLLLVEEAAREQSVAAGELPDPVVKLGVLNLPTDSLEFDQEPMTQFKVGLMQQFPAGDSLQIRARQVSLKGETNTRIRANRKLMIAREIKKLWLQTEFWQLTQKVLVEDEGLFNQLIEVTQSLYGVGRVNQQDLLSAELELIRLQDRMLNAELKEQEIRAELGRWIGTQNKSAELQASSEIWMTPDVLNTENHLLSHPRIQQLDLEIDVAGKTQELAMQDYKPKWGVEVGYGWRDGENPDGSSRADLMSAGINVQVPLFTGNRQDRKSRAAQHQQEALRYKRQDVLRTLLAQVDTEVQRERQFRERALFYQQKIIPKASAQTQASINSYQADTAAFSEVVRAALQVQELRLELLKIQMQKRQAIARLQYLLPD